MTALIGKELRQLIPFVFLWVGLLVLGYGSELATLRIDEQSYPDWCREYCQVGVSVDISIFEILFYMIAAYSLFPREYDDYTIDFLRTLPMRRSTVFVAKIIAAMLLFTVLVLLDRIISAGLLALNTQSLTGKFYWQVESVLFWRSCFFAFVVLSHGVFLSCFRTLGLVIYGLHLIGLLWLESATGRTGFYSIFEVSANEYDGSHLLVNTPAILFHTVVAIGLLLISYLFWTNAESKPVAAGVRRGSKLWPTVFAVVGFIIVAAWMFELVQRNADLTQGESLGTIETEHYTFVYNEEDRDIVSELSVFADADYRQLSELLGADNQPRIHADMTSESQHLLGQATWKKINMVISNVEDVNPLYRRVLNHETAHVFQTVESNRGLRRYANSNGFFIEGMAQYTSFAVVSDKDDRNSNWLVAAASWDRHNITFEELSNRSMFESLYDPELIYSIGDIWVEAFANTCGDTVLGDFLREVGKDDLSPTISGQTFWGIALQRSGCDLEEVNGRWRTLMRNLLDQPHASAFVSFDAISIDSEEDAARLEITASVQPDKAGVLPEQFLIRIDTDARFGGTVNPVIRGRLSNDGGPHTVTFSVLRSLINGSRFRYQLGYTPSSGSRAYYEKWQSGSLF